jgi:hypothetical protein
MKAHHIGLLVTMILGGIILGMRFEPVLQDPGAYLFEKYDGMKSYYNFSYYIKYDKGYRHDGINYPYGDHLQFINSHPLYSQVVKFIDNNIVDIEDSGVAIINLTMIISIWLAIPFIFLVFRHYKIPVWLAIIATLALLFLSPQVDRFKGHFEMVYAFYFPAFWYFFIKWRNTRKSFWIGLMIIISLVGGFTSAYFVAFMSTFVLAVLLVELLRHLADLRSFTKYGLQLLAIAVIPLLVVRGYSLATDWFDDRPDNPWGFYYFYANLVSVFVTNIDVIREFIARQIHMGMQWEGKAYIGFPAVIYSIIVVFFPLYYWLRLKKAQWKWLFPDSGLMVFFLASVVVLLFSMAIPFKWGLQFITEWIPQIKQFRAVGRFAWWFYYVAGVSAVVFFYSKLISIKKSSIRYTVSGLLAVLLVLWGIEARHHFLSSTRNVENENNAFRYGQGEMWELAKAYNINTEDYQAIFFLPFINTCGDKLLTERGDKGFHPAMELSYQTGIPIIQSYSPRLSFSSALSTYQMMADSAVYRSRFDDMPGKPFLLIAPNTDLRGDEEWFKAQSDVIAETDNWYLGTFTREPFDKAFDQWHIKADSISNSLACDEILCADVPDAFIIYNDFDDENTRGGHVFNGASSYFTREGTRIFWQGNPYRPDTNIVYEFSFWVYVDHRTFNMPEVNWYELNEEGHRSKRQRLNNRALFNIYGNWARFSFILDPEPDKKYSFEVWGRYVSIDDFLIKPVQSNVRIQTGTMTTLNNFPLREFWPVPEQ